MEPICYYSYHYYYYYYYSIAASTWLLNVSQISHRNEFVSLEVTNLRWRWANSFILHLNQLVVVHLMSVVSLQHTAVWHSEWCYCSLCTVKTSLCRITTCYSHITSIRQTAKHVICHDAICHQLMTDKLYMFKTETPSVNVMGAFTITTVNYV